MLRLLIAAALVLAAEGFTPSTLPTGPALRVAAAAATPVFMLSGASPFSSALRSPFGGNGFTPASGKRADFALRPSQPSDAVPLANLCTDSFYGEHTLADGPIKFAQRFAVLAKVLSQVSRRLSFEGKRECRLLVATDVRGGPVLGCIGESRAQTDRAREAAPARAHRAPYIEHSSPNPARHAQRSPPSSPHVWLGTGPTVQFLVQVRD